MQERWAVTYDGYACVTHIVHGLMHKLGSVLINPPNATVRSLPLLSAAQSACANHPCSASNADHADIS